MHLGTPLTLKSGDSLNPGGKGSRDVWATFLDPSHSMYILQDTHPDGFFLRAAIPEKYHSKLYHNSTRDAVGWLTQSHWGLMFIDYSVGNNMIDGLPNQSLRILLNVRFSASEPVPYDRQNPQWDSRQDPIVYLQSKISWRGFSNLWPHRWPYPYLRPVPGIYRST